MRKITGIVIHCSATFECIDIDSNTIRSWHTTPKNMGGRGWSDIGYHYIIRLDGAVERGRYEEKIGAHVRGHNKNTLGICYIGGLDNKGKPKDTRTKAQKHALLMLIESLCDKYQIKSIKGHRDYSEDQNKDGIIEKWEWMKSCPCFDVETEYKHLIK
jgi:N-acetyl-anhydromuramyl-L-alanine amidase AmpD